MADAPVPAFLPNWPIALPAAMPKVKIEMKIASAIAMDERVADFPVFFVEHAISG